MAAHGMPPPPPPAPMAPPFGNRPNPPQQQFQRPVSPGFFDTPAAQFQAMNLGGPGPGPNRGPAQKKPEPILPSYQGFILRKDPDPPNGGEPRWSCVYKNPIDVDSEELAQMVKKRQAKAKVLKQYDDLRSSNQRFQIDRLVKELKDAEQHPDAKWTLASIKDVRGRPENRRGDSETKELQVILKRQSKSQSDAKEKLDKKGNGKGKAEKHTDEVVHTGERVDLSEKPKTGKPGKGAFPKGPQPDHGNQGNSGQQFDRAPEGAGPMGRGPVGGMQFPQRPAMGSQPSFHQPNVPRGPLPPHSAPPQQRPSFQPRPAPPPVQVVQDPFDDDFDGPIQIVRGSSPSPGPHSMGGPPLQNRMPPVNQQQQDPQARHHMQPPVPPRPEPQQQPFQAPLPQNPQHPSRPQFRKEPSFGDPRAPEGPQRRNSMFERGRTNLGKKPKPHPVVVDQQFSSDEDSPGGSSQFSHGSAEFSSPISSPITGSIPSERAGRAYRGVDFMNGRGDKRYRKHRPREASEESFDLIDDLVSKPHHSNGRRYSGRRERDLALYKPRERLTRSERMDKEIYLDALEKRKRDEEVRRLERLEDEQRYEKHRRDRARKDSFRDSRRDSLDFGGLRSPTSPRMGRRDFRLDDDFDRFRY